MTNKRIYDREYFQVRHTDPKGKIVAVRARDEQEALAKWTVLSKKPGDITCTKYEEHVETERFTLAMLKTEPQMLRAPQEREREYYRELSPRELASSIRR